MLDSMRIHEIFQFSPIPKTQPYRATIWSTQN